MKKTKSISLALQGGGSFGAFTWGILDRLLEANVFDIKAISAASAGSMNAVALTQGYIEGGNQGARKTLLSFWHAVSERSVSLSTDPRNTNTTSFQPSSFMRALSAFISPYDANPFDINPLRDCLESTVDFDRIQQYTDLDLFISTTHVATGLNRVFRNPDIRCDVILASACLPQIFKAVSIDGDAYWDGGFSGNPPLQPLIDAGTSRDVLIVKLNPGHIPKTPTTAATIQQRMSEIIFQSALDRELERLVELQTIGRGRWFLPEKLKRIHKLRIHLIEPDEYIKDLSPDARLISDWTFLCDLRDAGRTAAEKWLDENYDGIGQRSTADLIAYG